MHAVDWRGTCSGSEPAVPSSAVAPTITGQAVKHQRAWPRIEMSEPANNNGATLGSRPARHFLLLTCAAGDGNEAGREGDTAGSAGRDLGAALGCLTSLTGLVIHNVIGRQVRGASHVPAHACRLPAAIAIACNAALPLCIPHCCAPPCFVLSMPSTSLYACMAVCMRCPKPAAPPPPPPALHSCCTTCHPLHSWQGWAACVPCTMQYTPEGMPPAGCRTAPASSACATWR